MSPPLARIVSGGQTGVDRGALDAALERGFPCGGWCPPGRLAEDGPIAARYPLVEMGHGGYAERTRQNVLDSDATVILYEGEIEGGTALTCDYCVEAGRPHCLIDARAATPEGAAADLAAFVVEHSAAVLNVAGPRASKAPRMQRFAYEVVAALLDGAAARTRG